MLFLQKVDDGAADALAYIENYRSKPIDPSLRDAWSRFLMSLIHRSPERIKYLAKKVQEYENSTLNPELWEKHKSLRYSNDPLEFDDWLADQDPLAPDLRVRLLKMLIDSKLIGSTLNAMHWSVYTLAAPRFGFLTGDQPIMMSNGLGHKRGFAMLPISPTRLFIAAHDTQVIAAFETQQPKALERAINDACTRQSHHVLIAQDEKQAAFIDKRFLKQAAPEGPNGLITWKSPLIDI